MFVIVVVVVPLVLTDSAYVAREIAETWVLNFRVPNVLKTQQEKSFRCRMIQKISRFLFIEEI